MLLDRRCLPGLGNGRTCGVIQAPGPPALFERKTLISDVLTKDPVRERAAHSAIKLDYIAPKIGI
jgi:hypothetical protein